MYSLKLTAKMNLKFPEIIKYGLQAKGLSHKVKH